MNTKRKILIIIISLISFSLFIIDLLSGSTNLEISNIIEIITNQADKNEGWYNVFFLFRLPRVLTAILAGAALSVSGLIMQTLFRNPLAGPYILGISSGASLGVALAVMGTGTGIMSQAISNLCIVSSGAIGAGAIMLIVSLISLKQKDIMTLLILGVLIGSIVTAIVGLLQYLSNAGNLKLYIIWTMGSLRSVSMQDLQFLFPVVSIGLGLSWIISKHLNLFLLGEENAKSMGTPVKTIRIIIFISVSLLAGSITAFCGPIGFIGIAVPHILRTLLRTTNHKILIPLSIISGAGMMCLADILSNMGPEDTVLPVNSITALIGIPFIFWLILSGRKNFFQ